MRTLVEVDTDAGITGLGEMGGGGESAELAFKGLASYLVGHDPFQLEALRFKIANPTASLYNNRTQLLAALEFACLDIMGQALGVPVHALLGGKLRDAVPFASYLFFRHPANEARDGEVRTAEQLVAHARALKAEHGFTSHKLKGGVFPPDHELACYRALADAFPGDSLRYDPNAALPLEEAIRFGRAIEDLRNDYYEDPVWGLNGMRQVRAAVAHPDRHQHGRGQFRAARHQPARPRRRRDPARHHLLGRHPALHQGGRRLRDLPDRHRGPLLGRARHPARHDAAPGRRPAQPHLRRRRPLPPPRRRRDRGRQAPLPRWRASPCRTRRASACASTATGSSAGPTTIAASAATPTTATRSGPGWFAMVPNTSWADPLDDRVPTLLA